MRKKKTLPKKDRWPPYTTELHKEYLDAMETIECADWAHDCKMREWKNSEDYAKRKELAERFASSRTVAVTERL